MVSPPTSERSRWPASVPPWPTLESAIWVAVLAGTALARTLFVPGSAIAVLFEYTQMPDVVVVTGTAAHLRPEPWVLSAVRTVPSAPGPTTPKVPEGPSQAITPSPVEPAKSAWSLILSMTRTARGMRSPLDREPKNAPPEDEEEDEEEQRMAQQTPVGGVRAVDANQPKHEPAEQKEPVNET